MDAPSVRGPSSAAERDEFAEHAARSFNIPMEELRQWLIDLDDDLFYALRKQGHVKAGCLGFSSGHFLGGKPVSGLALALVFVAPHERGHGYSSELLASVLSAARKRGTSISSLHPARLSPYRKVGYELAGSLFRHRIPLASVTFAGRAEGFRLEPMRPGDEAKVEAFFGHQAVHCHGELTRELYMWRRVRGHRGSPADAYVLRDATGQLCGYLLLRRQALPDGPHDLVFNDAWASSGEGYRAMLDFARSHNSVARDLVYYGPVADPMLLELGENRWETKLVHQWMLRILHLENALTERGYPRHVRGQVCIEVEDELLEENAGCWRLALDNGEMSVTRSESAPVKMNVAAMAPLYTGLFSATELARSGRIVGTTGDLELLDAIFAAPHPCIGQYF